jgi:hypothetical protein
MKLEVISLSLIFFTVLVITLGIIKIHTYPGKVAEARNHPQTKAIEVTSLLGLLVFPLWMAALVWAYSGAIVGRLYAVDAGEIEGSDPTSKSQTGDPVAHGEAAPSSESES